jgi:hypothetical protein
LSVSPGSISVEQGATSAAVTVAVNPINGFTGSVSIAVEGLPAGVTSSPASPFSVAAGQNQQVTFSASTSAAVDSSTLTFRGTSGTLSHSATLTLSVTQQPPANFTVTVNPASVSMSDNGTATVAVQVDAVGAGSTNFSVDLALAPVPQGVTGSFTPAAISPGAVATLTLVSVDALDVTDFSLTVTGTRLNDGATASAAFLLTVVTPWTVGGGQITGLQFSADFPQADVDYITDLFNDGYPVMEQIFGLPPDTFTLNVNLCSWSYDANTHTMCISVLPTALPASPFSFARNFYHELGHAFTSSEHFTELGWPNWVREGLADAVDTLVMRVLGEEGIRSEISPLFVAELDYFALARARKEVIGGVDGKVWKGGGEAASLSATSGHHLFLILAATQSQANVGDWRSYTALKDLKEEVFSIANAKQATPTYDDFLAAAATVFSVPIEGLPPATWIDQQPIAYTTGTPGTYLFVRPVPAANPVGLSVVAFTRSSEEVVPGVLRETPAASGTVTITITNVRGLVETITFDLSNANHFITFDTTDPLKYWTGGYRIQVSGTVDGVSVTGPDSYFGIYDRTLVPAGQHVAMIDKALFLIGINPADGTVSSNLFPALAGGSYLQNIDGAAIWKSDALSIPASVSVLGRELPLPLPFSLVVVLDNP